jgi:simple sugar transport system ATP-binding protein
MIELTNIHKYFGQVKALQGVSLNVAAGSIHGVVGENGAGKSTLMKVLTGYIGRTSGTVSFKGSEINLQTPKDAQALGIGMLYQEPLDFYQLSVLDNFMAGADRYDRSGSRTALAELTRRFGFELDPKCPVQRLTVGERQQLELIRLIHSGVRVLILDEPTTGISEQQQELLFAALQALKDDGCAIILVSHKLSEVDSLCDRVSILRQGRIVGHQEQPFNRDAILHAMFGTLPDHTDQPDSNGHHRDSEKQIRRSEILSFERVSSTVGRSGLNQVTISIQEGEVVGLAGLDGSGQTVFLKIAAHLLEPEAGTVLGFGKNPVQNRKIYDPENKPVFLPADRLSEGLIPGLSIREHLLLASEPPLFMTTSTGRARAEQAIATYNILGSPESLADGLSGGNQQRLLLSLMPARARLILMENPTRGLDVQSGSWTWQHLQKQLPENGAIIFASPDLEEIMEHASRVLVFFNGLIILDKLTGDTSFDEISRAITGQVAAESQEENVL